MPFDFQRLKILMIEKKRKWRPFSKIVKRHGNTFYLLSYSMCLLLLLVCLSVVEKEEQL
jgi:hypothetical protein